MAAPCPAPKRLLEQKGFILLRFLAQATGLKHLGLEGCMHADHNFEISGEACSGTRHAAFFTAWARKRPR
jgi:hypothetical protein